MLTIEVREKLKNSTKDLKGEENLHKHAQAAILPTDAFKLQISAQKKAPRLGLVNILVQYVAQYPDGTSIRTLTTKTQFLRRSFQLSVNKVFRMKAEHFGFKMKVLAS